MTDSTQEITIEDANYLVGRAGFTLRSRPFPGSDPESIETWQQSAEAFLHSDLIQRALDASGVHQEPGAPYPTDSLDAFLAALGTALGPRRNSAVAVLVATAVAGTITGFLAGCQLGDLGDEVPDAGQ